MDPLFRKTDAARRRASRSAASSRRARRRSSRVLDELAHGALDVARVLEHERLVERAVGEAHLLEIVELRLPLGRRREVARARLEVGAVALDDELEELLVGEAHRGELALELL